MADADSVLPDTSGNDDERTDEQIWSDLAAKNGGGPSEEDTAPAEPAAEPATDTPDGDPATPPVTEPSSDDGAGAEPEPDPWADAPEPLRTAHEAVLKERDEAIEKERRAAGALPGQTRKINDLIADNQRLNAELGKRPAAPGTDAGGQTDEDPELVQARADYPEVVGPLEKSNDQLRAELRDFRSEVNQRFAAQDEKDQTTYVTDQAARLAEKHPDWREVKDSSAFVEWSQSQPPMVQQAISDSVDAAEMSLVLSLFKQESADPNPSGNGAKPPDTPKTAAADARRQLQIDSASTPKAKGPPQITKGMPEDDEGIWNHYLEKRKRAEAATQ